MVDIPVDYLRTIQSTFAAAGENHVVTDDVGNVATTTKTFLGRLAGRVASRLSPTASARNEHTIAALTRQIRNTYGRYGSFADTFKKNAANATADGKPLSGRAVAALLDTTIAEVTNQIADMELKQRIGDLHSAMTGYCLAADCDDYAVPQWTHEIDETAAKLSGDPKELEAAAAKLGMNSFVYQYMRKHRHELLPRLQEVGKLTPEQWGDTPKELGRKIWNNVISHFANLEKPLLPEKLVNEIENYLQTQQITVFGNRTRQNVYHPMAAPLFDAEGPNGLLAALDRNRSEKEKSVPLNRNVAENMGARLYKNVYQSLHGKTLPDADELARIRDTAVTKYIEETRKWLSKVYPNDVEWTLALLPQMKPELRDMTVQLANRVEQIVPRTLETTDMAGLRKCLEELGDLYVTLQEEVKAANPEKDFGAEDFIHVNNFAYAVGLQRVTEAIGSARMAAIMSAPDSPFIDLAYDVREQSSDLPGDFRLKPLIAELMYFASQGDGVTPEQAERLSMDTMTIDSTSLRYRQEKQ